MVETDGARTIRATKLYVEVGGAESAETGEGWLDGADGVVLEGGAADAGSDERITSCDEHILLDANPENVAGWRARAGTLWVAGGGLDAIMPLRDAWPALNWVPRIEVYRPETRFDFHRAAPGEGFSMYMPDTAAIQGFRIAGAERETLEAWLARAVSEGFRRVWLHGRDADAAGKGADIEMLARARRHFAGGRIWLSGGIAEPRHLKTLAREGGAKAVVVPASVARQYGCMTLASALELSSAANHPVAAGLKPAGCPGPHRSA